MRRASISLSVNAIIIFVLAFAMLGVGIYVTKRVQNLSEQSTDKAQDIIDSIQEDPTSDKPLVGVGKELSIPNTKLYTSAVKFYNYRKDDATAAVVAIDKCKHAETGDTVECSAFNDETSCPVTVQSGAEDVKPSEIYAMSFSVKNRLLKSGQTYICKLFIMADEGDPDTPEDVYYTHSMHLTVQS